MINISKALRLLRQARKSPNARVEILEAIRLSPENPAGHLFLGIIEFDAHEFDSSMTAFTRCLELSPNNQTAISFIAFINLLADKIDKGIVKTIKDNLRYANIDFQSRFLQHIEGHLSKLSAPDLAPMIEHFFPTQRPSSFDILSSKLKSYFVTNKDQKIAYDYYQSALSNLAEGKNDIAIAELRESLNRQPSYRPAKERLMESLWTIKDYEGLMILMKETKEFTEVFGLLEKTVSTGGLTADEIKDLDSAADRLFIISCVCFQLGDYKHAEAGFKLLTEPMEYEFSVFYALALCCLMTNREKDSIDAFRMSLSRLDEGFLDKRVSAYLDSRMKKISD